MDCLEARVYKNLCAGCERERACHNNCEVCEEFEDELEEARKTTAIALIGKLFKSGWLSNKYGFIDVANTYVDYPLREEETKFLIDYFGGH